MSVLYRDTSGTVLSGRQVVGGVETVNTTPVPLRLRAESEGFGTPSAHQGREGSLTVTRVPSRSPTPVSSLCRRRSLGLVFWSHSCRPSWSTV